MRIAKLWGRKPKLSFILPLLLAGLSLAACDSEDAPIPEVSRESPILPLETATVLIEADADSHYVSVEIAETQEQKSTGLMERRSMPEDEGMLFTYPGQQDPSDAFYMFRTRIPLDIAFLDGDGRIVAIRQMEPCTSAVAQECERYAPGTPYSAALEVNHGYFDSRGVEVGDRVTLLE